MVLRRRELVAALRLSVLLYRLGPWIFSLDEGTESYLRQSDLLKMLKNKTVVSWKD